MSQKKLLNKLEVVDSNLRQKIADGLLYAHSRTNSNTTKTLETSSFLYALVELLNERGVITIDELDDRKKIVGDRLTKEFKEKGMGAMLQEPEYDKYKFNQQIEIDCENRVQHCKAACCRLPFALSKQDIYEGIVNWDLGQPYMIEHGDDGYCNHLDRCNMGCKIHKNRPVPCRGFDCSKDKRIWLDFEKMVPNPEIHRPDWPGCLAEKNGINGNSK